MSKEIIETKSCRECRIEKPIKQFTHKRNGKLYYHFNCFACKSMLVRRRNGVKPKNLPVYDETENIWSKECSRCKQVLPDSAFYTYQSNGQLKFPTQCKLCRFGKIDKSCVFCNKIFHPKSNSQICCSTKCRNSSLHLKKRNPSGDRENFLCLSCNDLKPKNCFYTNAGFPISKCKPCHYQYVKDNPKRLERVRRWYANGGNEAHKRYWQSLSMDTKLEKGRKAREKVKKRIETATLQEKEEHRKKRREQVNKWLNGLSEDKRKNLLARQQKSSSKRRAMERGVEIINFSKAEIIKRDGLNCYLCNKLLTEKQATVEHIIPLIRGGKHKPENVKIACLSCNSRKGAKTLTEFKKYRGDYSKFQTK